MSSTLAQLTQIQHEFDSRHASQGRLWSQSIGQDDIPLLLELTVALAGEVGEFANVAKKLARGDLNFEAARPKFASELADIFIYLLKLGDQLGIDIEGAFRQKLRFNEQRFSEFSLQPPR